MMTDIFTYRNESPGTSVNDGPLSGKKIVIQPNMSVRGWQCDAGSTALARFTALEDATALYRLMKGGAELVGSGRMSEFGFGLTGDSILRIIATGEAQVALVTDMLGEARIAACAAGIFGFKPSYGVVSRFGLIGLIPSMECYGILANNPSDIASVMDIISGSDEKDFSMPDEDMPDFRMTVRRRKVPAKACVLKECLAILEGQERKAFTTGLGKFEEAGIKIEEMSLVDFDLFSVVHNVVGSVEASSSAGKYDGVRYGHRDSSAKNWNDMYLNSRGESFGELMKSYLFQGAYFQFENYHAFENACRIRQRLIKETNALLEHVETLILPTRRIGNDLLRASTVKEVYDSSMMTLQANVAGLPSLHIPSLAVDSGFDAGIQIIGPRLSDASLLSAGMWFSSSTQGVEQI